MKIFIIPWFHLLVGFEFSRWTYWTINKSTGHKERRIVSLEIHSDNDLPALVFMCGPIIFLIGKW